MEASMLALAPAVALALAPDLLTVIPLDTFLNTIAVVDTFGHLVAQLDKYKCFVTNGGEKERVPSGNQGGGGGGHGDGGRGRRRYGEGGRGGHGGRGYHSQHAPTKHKPERPRIGMRELSRADMCKKEFLAFMNKLSPQNKETIVKQVVAKLAPMHTGVYCEVLWALMQRPVQIYQPYYAEMARTIAMSTPMPEKLEFKRAWDKRWESVVQGDTAFAVVPEAFHDAAIISNDNDFLEWTIWKRSHVNLIKACMYLCTCGVFTQGIGSILDPVMVIVDQHITTETNMATHLLDYYIDLLSNAWASLVPPKDNQPPKDIHEKLTAWLPHVPKLSPATRFKVLALSEKYLTTKR